MSITDNWHQLCYSYIEIIEICPAQDPLLRTHVANNKS